MHSAKINVPTRFAPKITDHSRKTPKIRSRVCFDSNGRITVSVVSVKSCWRPNMTIRNPTLYPNFEISAVHEACGRVRSQQRFGDQRKSHRKSGREARPSQRGGRPLEFFLSFTADRFIHDVRPDRQTLFHFLFVGSCINCRRFLQSGGSMLFFAFHLSSVIPWA